MKDQWMEHNDGSCLSCSVGILPLAIFHLDIFHFDNLLQHLVSDWAASSSEQKSFKTNSTNERNQFEYSWNEINFRLKKCSEAIQSFQMEGWLEKNSFERYPARPLEDKKFYYLMSLSEPGAQFKLALSGNGSNKPDSKDPRLIFEPAVFACIPYMHLSNHDCQSLDQTVGLPLSRTETQASNTWNFQPSVHF